MVLSRCGIGQGGFIDDIVYAMPNMMRQFLSPIGTELTIQDRLLKPVLNGLLHRSQFPRADAGIGTWLGNHARKARNIFVIRATRVSNPLRHILKVCIDRGGGYRSILLTSASLSGLLHGGNVSCGSSASSSLDFGVATLASAWTNHVFPTLWRAWLRREPQFLALTTH